MSPTTRGRAATTDALTRHTIRRVALLINPEANKGMVGERARRATHTFVRGGVDVVQLSGATPAASQKLARGVCSSPDFDALVVCGGDGLINLALQEQAGTGMPLGIIPAGTGNDHAREYHIPDDARSAARIIMDGYGTHTDLGMMSDGRGNTRYFGTLACMGFDSLTNDRTNRVPFPRGSNRYLVAGLIEFLSFYQRPTRIVIDGQLAFSGLAAMSAVGNTRSYGGGRVPCPFANHHDGLLDLSVLTNTTRPHMLAHAKNIADGSWWKMPNAKMFRARRIRIDMAGITAYADGEPAFKNSIQFEAVPNAGYYLVPRP